MSAEKPLSLPYRLEPAHPSLSHPSRFMRLLGPVILILLGAVDRLGYQLTMRYSITTQLVSDDLSGFATMVA